MTNALLNTPSKPRMQQLPLAFNLRDESTFQSFYAGDNAHIVTVMQCVVESVVESVAEKKGERFIYLHGEPGDGLSHLLQAVCQHAAQQKVSSIYLPLKDLLALPDINTPEVFAEVFAEAFAALETLAIVCIDDLDVLVGQPRWEEAFFHLFNRIQVAGGALIMTAHDSPMGLSMQLKDLQSRLSGCMVYAVQSLKDEEKKQVLVQRAAARGIALTEEVVQYLLTHCDRHIGVLMQTLDVLDQASLVTQRKVTIPFIKATLSL